MNADPAWAVEHERSRVKWVVPAIFAAVAFLLIAAGLLVNRNGHDDFTRARQTARTSAIPAQTPVAPLNLVKPLSPDEAIKANEERPFDSAPDTAARTFKLGTDGTSRDRALECLTQAVYYEAASESADGQRAVAQVVLNRMRHPGFPSTVCGVVYQGSELPTGCQFTFTCDGSLARTPIAAVWTRARKIAQDALAGHVFAAVGHATHYHADYVLPYWADSLAKQVQIGHHIFYRLKGGLGSDPAFSQRYAGKEPDLPAPSTIAVASQAAEQAQALLNPGVSGPPPLVADAAGLAAAGTPKQVLLADSTKGALLIDQGAKPSQPKKPRASEQCEEKASKQVRPATPDDLRAGREGNSC